MFQSPASFAATCWTWEASAAEKGYFVADNGDGASPNSYVITDFKVTATAAGATSATSFVVNNGGAQGILWNGTAATQFWRPGATNGWNIYTPTATAPYKRWILAVGYYNVTDNAGATLVATITSMTVALDSTGAACAPPVTPSVSAPISLISKEKPHVFATEVKPEN